MKWTEFSAILRPSTVAGVGVFVTHNIPAGMRVFSEFLPRKAKIEDIPTEFRSYCIFLSEKECLCPKRFDRMEIGWYMNHSKSPNIEKRADGNLYAIKFIQAGEEILIDYNQFNEPENLKESYFRECR